MNWALKEQMASSKPSKFVLDTRNALHAMARLEKKRGIYGALRLRHCLLVGTLAPQYKAISS